MNRFFQESSAGIVVESDTSWTGIGAHKVMEIGFVEDQDKVAYGRMDRDEALDLVFKILEWIQWSDKHDNKNAMEPVSK